MIEYLIAYLVGSINFAFLIARFLFKEDLSRFGDENLGATNLYYLIRDKYENKKLAFLLFLLTGFLDALKAFLIALFFGPLVGSFVVFGHCFSIFSIILTKKIPSGVGFASTIGWVFATDIKIFLFMILFIPFYFLFGKYFEVERGHIFTIFAYPLSGWIYTILFPNNYEIIYSLLIIVISVSFARLLRIRKTLERCLK